MSFDAFARPSPFLRAQRLSRRSRKFSAPAGRPPWQATVRLHQPESMAMRLHVRPRFDPPPPSSPTSTRPHHVRRGRRARGTQSSIRTRYDEALGSLRRRRHGCAPDTTSVYHGWCRRHGRPLAALINGDADGSHRRARHGRAGDTSTTRWDIGLFGRYQRSHRRCSVRRARASRRASLIVGVKGSPRRRAQRPAQVIDRSWKRADRTDRRRRAGRDPGCRDAALDALRPRPPDGERPAAHSRAARRRTLGEISTPCAVGGVSTDMTRTVNHVDIVVRSIDAALPRYERCSGGAEARPMTLAQQRVRLAPAHCPDGARLEWSSRSTIERRRPLPGHPRGGPAPRLLRDRRPARVVERLLPPSGAHTGSSGRRARHRGLVIPNAERVLGSSSGRPTLSKATASPEESP